MLDAAFVRVPALVALSLVVMAFALATPREASAFGPLGHRIAGLLAEPQLCRAAREQIDTLGDGESLAELGVWADTARGIPAWRASAPWHYMNIDADTPQLANALEAIRGFRAPAEGDVLSAIERFRAELGDAHVPSRERSAALKFLVHFVVDIHQPLHVGRAEDRGGNTIDVRYGLSVANLHRFWDSDVLELRMLDAQRYARRMRRSADITTANARAPPEVWAAESLALREKVYSFARGGAEPYALSAAYVATAQVVIDERLALGAARLAATLNAVFCGSVAR